METSGPGFWDQGVLTVTGLNSIPMIASLEIKDLPLNDLFLFFSTGGLFINAIAATHNVYGALNPTTRSFQSILKPLSRLGPYLVHTLSMILWLHAQPEILYTELLIPFACFWGITFAHHVGLLIIAHLTKAKFPDWYRHPLLLLSILGAVDANILRALGRVSYGHGNHQMIKWTVGACLISSLMVYTHFVWEVVGDICEFYNIK